MTLSDRDLSQMDTDYLDDLPEGQLRALSKQLLKDLKEASPLAHKNAEHFAVVHARRSCVFSRFGRVAAFAIQG